MSYIGSDYTQQLTTPAVDYFNGNGVTTTFQLTRSVTSVNAIQVVVNNVPQNAREAYGITSSNQIVFTSAPSAGTNNIYVIYDSQVGQFVTPSPGTVGTAALNQITNISSGASNFTLRTGGSDTAILTATTNAQLLISGSVGINVPTPLRSFHTFGENSFSPLPANQNNVFFNAHNITGNSGTIMSMWFRGLDINSTIGTSLATFIVDATTSTFSGRVLAPNQPMFYAKGPESNTTLSNGADLNFNNAIQNTGGHYNTTTFRFTAPVAGNYLFTWSFFINGAPTGRATLKINGGAYNNLQMDCGGAMSQSAIIKMAAGDFASVGDWQSISGQVIYMGHSHFSGILL
jgi:hypothetical protein